MTSTVDNKRVVTRDLYLRGETGANPGGDTVPRFGTDGKMQFSTVTVDSGGSLGVPGSAVIQGDLTVIGLINGGAGGGGGGGGVSVVAGPSGNVTVATAAGVATVDLAPLLTGVDISGDIDVTGELEAKSLRVLTGAIVDGAFSAGSANIIGAAHVEGALTGGSTVTATGKIRSTGGDIEAINGILSGALAVDGAATVGSLKANQTVTVAGKLAADAADISRNVAVGGNVDVSGVVTAAGLVLRNAFVVDTLQVRGAATISGDLYVNSTIHHVGLFDPPVGGTTVLQGGAGIDVTENPAVPGEWTITYTGGGGGGGGGISGVDEGSNIEVSGSGTNPTISVRINETLDMCNNKITNVDIIELVTTATDTEDPRVSFKDVNGVQRAQVEYNQDNQAEPLLLLDGPRVLIEATEADNVSGVTLATAGNTLTVTDASVDLGVPLLTMGGVTVSVGASKNFVIDNTNTGGGYKIKSVPDVAGASGFDDMLVYNVTTGEIRQTPAPTGTDICGGTNILVDKSTPAEPVVSLEVREDIDMGGKGLVSASSVGFSSGGSIVEGGAGSLRFTTKVGVNTAAGAIPAQELEVNGGVQAQKLYLTGMADAASAYPKVLGYNSTTKEIVLQDAGSGGGGGSAVSSVITGPSGNLTVNQSTGNVMVDLADNIAITGNLGIGTGTPGATLDVNGGVYIRSGLSLTGNIQPISYNSPIFIRGSSYIYPIEFSGLNREVTPDMFNCIVWAKNTDSIEKSLIIFTSDPTIKSLPIGTTFNVASQSGGTIFAIELAQEDPFFDTKTVTKLSPNVNIDVYTLVKVGSTGAYTDWANMYSGDKVDSVNVGSSGNLTVTQDTGNVVVDLASNLSIAGTVGIGKSNPQQALDVAGNITASGSVSGGSLSTSGTVTATGNVSGGSISTGGTITATGNVSGGSISTSGTVTATGNISTTGRLTGASVVSGVYISGQIGINGDVTLGMNDLSMNANTTGGCYVTAYLESDPGCYSIGIMFVNNGSVIRVVPQVQLSIGISINGTGLRVQNLSSITSAIHISVLHIGV